MPSRIPSAVAFIASMLLPFAMPAAHAQTFQTLHSWQVDTYYPITSLVRGNDGNFYGTTSQSSALPSIGSGYGVAYRITPQGAFRVLHAFGYDLTPTTGLVQGPDDAFYGMTRSGGANFAGTVYRLTADGTFAQLLDFSTTQAGNPTAALANGADGNLYGTTPGGGANGAGTFFRITPAGRFTLLHSFNATTGRSPRGRLLLADGSFYGVTNTGGTNNRGTIYKVTPAGVATVLFNFPSSGTGNPVSGLTLAADGSFYGLTDNEVFRITPQGAFSTVHTFATATGLVPTGDLVAAGDGDLYGTTIRGAANGLGGVYRLTTAGAVTLVRSFNNATHPGEFAAVIESGPGTLAGVTNGRYGPSTRGTIFTLSTTGTAPNVLHAFATSDGKTPSGPLLEGEGGLYSTTTFYNSSSGTVYRLNDATQTVTTLHVFPYGGPIGQAKGGLTKGADNSLYGLSEGSSGNDGVAYRLGPAGQSPVALNTFNTGRGGRRPRGRMTQAGDGNLYGVTSDPGYNEGTVFKLTPAGALTTAFSFGGAKGAGPNSPLVPGTDGGLYGTTSSGGSNDRGVIFRMTPGPTPAVATVVTFNNTNGQTPTGELLAAADGNLYGTTLYGGTNNRGTVFRVTNAGVHSVFANLGTTSAARPQGAIVRLANGDIYGVTSEGGANGVGCVYRVSAAGVTSLLHSFTTTGPRTPMAGLTPGPDGLLYGTTTRGGNGGLGTIFKITTTGALTHFRHFDYGTGDMPLGALFRASNGALYGLNENGGTGGAGTLYRVALPPVPAILAASNLGTTTATLNGTVVPYVGPTVVRFDYSTSAVFAGNVFATPNQEIAAGSTPVPLAAAITGLTPGTLYHARVVAQNPGGTVTTTATSFTTNAPPTGGNLTVSPAVAAPGATVQLAATGWTDPHTPLTYQFFLAGTPLAPAGASPTATFAAPATPGVHPVKLRVADALGAEAEADASLVVNNPPVLRESTLGAVAGSTVRIAVAKLLRYGSDPDGDAIQLIAVSPTSAQGGTIVLLAGAIDYTAAAGYSGPDSFTYTVRDASGSIATGTVNVTVVADNGPSLNVVSITRTAAGFLVRFAGVPGESYRIQYRDPPDASWRLLDPPGALIAGPNGLFEHEDKPNPQPAARFYRAIAP